MAAVLGWSVQRTRRWFQRANRNGQACVFRNGRWVTTRRMLREQFPEVWQDIMMNRQEDD